MSTKYTEPGPYGTLEPFIDERGRKRYRHALTEEGKRQLELWLLKWPRPLLLYRRAYGAECAYMLSTHCISEEDINAACMVGVTRAMCTWIPSDGEFSTYAAYFTRSHVQKWIADYNESKRRNKYGINVMSYHKITASTSPQRDDHDYTNHPALAVSDPDPMQRDLVQTINEVLRSIHPRAAMIFKRYFGICGERKATLKQLGLDYRITRERVRQIKERAAFEITERMPSLAYYLEK